jgi:uncharacterized protein DUF6886
VRLFHFSDDPAIERFVPRPVSVPSDRGEGRDWLNGPLVWAVDEWHSPMFFFPRECPRVLLWPLPGTTPQDRERWLGSTAARIVAHVERTWWDRLRSAAIHRYEVPAATFESLDDAGMHVSRSEVTPLGVRTLSDLPDALAAAGVELRVLEDLTPLRGAWVTTLHASGIRLRNARGWRT